MTPTPMVTTVPPTLIATPQPAVVFPAQFSGDAKNGAALFQTMGCVGCHIKPKQGRMIAPDLSHIATEAGEIIQRPDYHGRATSAQEYLYESITNPNAFVLPPYNALTIDGTSIMPQDFARRMTPAQIQDVIAFLMTMR